MKTGTLKPGGMLVIAGVGRVVVDAIRGNRVQLTAHMEHTVRFTQRPLPFMQEQDDEVKTPSTTR